MDTTAERIKAIRGDMTQSEFAKAVGVHKNTLGRYERGESEPDVVSTRKICSAFGIEPKWFIFGEGPMRRDKAASVLLIGRGTLDGKELKQITGPGRRLAAKKVGEDEEHPYCDEHELLMVPKVKARLSAGGGSFEVDDDVEGYYAFKTDWIIKRGNPYKMALMAVTGDSMEPDICDDDTVLIDQSQNEILSDKIYAVGIEDAVVIKVVKIIPGKMLLISKNKEHSPIEIELHGDLGDTVRIIGRVVWWCREAR